MWVDHEVQRLQLDFDLGIMELDANGVRIEHDAAADGIRGRWRCAWHRASCRTPCDEATADVPEAAGRIGERRAAVAQTVAAGGAEPTARRCCRRQLRTQSQPAAAEPVSPRNDKTARCTVLGKIAAVRAAKWAETRATLCGVSINWGVAGMPSCRRPRSRAARLTSARPVAYNGRWSAGAVDT